MCSCGRCDGCCRSLTIAETYGLVVELIRRGCHLLAAELFALLVRLELDG